MKTTIKTATRGICFALGLLTASSLAHAAGFAIYENDARGFAMANANVGRNDDASALYSNPAAITQLPGLQIKAGLSFIMPSVDVSTWGSMKYTPVPGKTETNPFYLAPGIANPDTPNETTSMNSYTAIVPNLYVTYRINDDMAAGLSFHVPYGLKSDFQKEPASWPGAYNNFFTDVQSYQITPTFAYRLVHDQPWAKQISVAAGISMFRFDITIKRQMAFALLQDPTSPYDPGTNPFRASGYTPLVLKGGTWKFGYNFAVQFEVNDQLAFGIVYRSGYSVKITGASAEIIGMRPQVHNAWGKITLPDSWSFGVNYSPVVPLNLGFQALRTNWSSYNNLTMEPFPVAGVPANPSITPKNWKDVWRYCFGAEYQYTNQVALRAGLVIDKDPVNPSLAEYMVPSNDRVLFSVGAGWTINKNLIIDFALGYIRIKGRHIDARPEAGVLKTFVHTGNAKIFSISGNYRF